MQSIPKVFLIGAVMAMGWASPAFADEAKVYVVGSKPMAGNLHMHCEEVPNGLYVVAYKSTGSINNVETDTPAISNFIKGLIAKRGFKIADKLEGSSAALMFGFGGDVDLSAVETQLANPEKADNAVADKTLLDQSKASVYGSMAIQGVATGNQAMGAMGAAHILGSFISSDKAIRMIGVAQPNPVIVKHTFGGDTINKEGRLSNSYLISYRPAENVRDVSPEMKALLENIVNKWLDAFMVAAPVAAPTAQVDKSNVAVSSHPE